MAKLVCIASGLTVSGIDLARTFPVGDELDPDVVVATRAGGTVVTWRDALGRYLESHFAPVQTSAQADPKPRRPRAIAAPGADTPAE